MKNELTLQELEELHEKTGATVEINDGEIRKITKGTAPEKKKSSPRFREKKSKPSSGTWTEKEECTF